MLTENDILANLNPPTDYGSIVPYILANGQGFMGSATVSAALQHGPTGVPENIGSMRQKHSMGRCGHG
jgi:hypothetical protein